MSVKANLTIIYSTIMALTLAAFGLASFALTSSGLNYTLQESTMSDFERVKMAASVSQTSDLSELSVELNIMQAEGSIFLYDTASGAVFGNPGLATEIRSALSGFIPVGGLIEFRETISGNRLLAIGPYDDSTLSKILVIARDSTHIDSILDEFKKISLASIPFAVVIAAASGYLLANRSMRQVKVITATADGINPADLKDRIPVRHNDELGRLSLTLNSLFDRIHGFIQRQHRFTSDASHDLKAPITFIKAEADLALRGDRPPEEYRRALTTVTGQMAKMQFIIDDLMTLASLDAGPRPTRSSTIDLGMVLNCVAEDWEAVGADKGIELRRDIQPGIRIYGEPDQFERLFDNLLSNAMKFTPAGGTVSVALEENGGNITATVTDNGIGIQPDQLPCIFERFYRVNREVEGTGLGLSIVKGTTEIYGGRVLVTSDPGKGSTFNVILPVNGNR